MVGLKNGFFSLRCLKSLIIILRFYYYHNILKLANKIYSRIQRNKDPWQRSSRDKWLFKLNEKFRGIDIGSRVI